MFSDEDILEICASGAYAEASQSKDAQGLPVLIQTSRGDGFVTERKLMQDFAREVAGATTREPLSKLGDALSIKSETLLQLVRIRPDLALVSYDELHIVPQQGRDAVLNELEKSLGQHLVIRNEFATQHNIHVESLKSLIRTSYINTRLEQETDEYLLSKAYSTTLSDRIAKVLEEGSGGSETIELNPQSLPGTPPTWLIQQYFRKLAGAKDLESQFHIEEDDNSIRCMPKKSLLGKRDEIIAQLQSGKIFCFERSRFHNDFKSTYASLSELEKQMSELDSITSIGAFLISTGRLSEAANDGTRTIKEQGYTKVANSLPSETPMGIRSEVEQRMAQLTTSLCANEKIDVKKVGDFICAEIHLDEQKAGLVDVATTQANRDWEHAKAFPDKDPSYKFQIAEALASMTAEDDLKRTVYQEKELNATAAENYLACIAKLEEENESAFSTFWVEKVASRVHNYNDALTSVKDAKLQGQLAELLASYLQKEFLPDMTSKARTQALVCSRRTRKNLSRFEVTLKTSKSDLASVLSILGKFGKKQGVSEEGVETATEAKKTLLQDIVRRMQKPKTDAPLMFLSLVVVLFAKHGAGVIYATGKFAPKLLKQLKSNLGEAEYESLEKWKEMAKAGTLSKEYRADMVQMAEQALE